MKSFLRAIIPANIRYQMRVLHGKALGKKRVEMGFWQSRFREEGQRFNNEFYERYMIAMTGASDASFFDGKVVADFGCGPRGSLAWMSGAKQRIGIDVLASAYFDEFPMALASHGTVYLDSTEDNIPLPNEYCDIVITLNAIDHVDNFEKMVSEIFRVLKLGGVFAGSFNLQEPVTPAEPQSLVLREVKDTLSKYMDITDIRASMNGPKDNEYDPLFNHELIPYEEGQPGILWVRGNKTTDPN